MYECRVKHTNTHKDDENFELFMAINFHYMCKICMDFMFYIIVWVLSNLLYRIDGDDVVDSDRTIPVDRVYRNNNMVFH